MSDIGSFLRELRGKRSLRSVEEESGVSHTYLSSLEKGADPRTGKERKPSAETLKKLADVYNYSYIDLLAKAGYLNLKEDDFGGKVYTTTDKDILYLLTQEEIVFYNGKLLTDEQRRHAVAMLETLFKHISDGEGE